MSTRAALIMQQANLSRAEMAAGLGCDPSTVSRLCLGRHETPPQSKLLDILASEHGLPHLLTINFSLSSPPAAASPPAACGLPAAAPGSPGGGGGDSGLEGAA